MHISVHRSRGVSSIAIRHTEGVPEVVSERPTKRARAGLRKATKARNAEEAIGQSEGLVTVLRLTQADLTPAEDSIRIAKHLFDDRQYTKAFRAAKRAESLALSLDERFNAYQEAAKALRERIEAMRNLGLPTATIEGVPHRAEEQVVAGTWDDDIFVPDYVAGRVLLERAEREGRTVQEDAERASNAIFAAELAIERLVQIEGPPDPIVFANGVGALLEAALHYATRELAIGNAKGATLIARDLEAKAASLRTLFGEATRNLASTEAHLAELRGEGILTERHEGQTKMARDLLAKGLIEPGSAMATRLMREVMSFGETYRKATTGLADAEVVYGRLKGEGFRSYDADVALEDTRTAVRKGNYARAIEHLERAFEAFQRRTNAGQTLAKSIFETQARIEGLQGSGLSFLPDIQDVLARAEREFAGGNYSDSSEDLRLATVLLDQATRPLGPKK